MGKLENLMPIQEVNARRTPEQRSKAGAKAGRASGKARREKADLFRAMDLVMEKGAVGKTKDMLEALGYKGEELTNGNALAVTLLAQALKGNTKAAELLLQYKMQMREDSRKNAESKARIQAMANNSDAIQVTSGDDDDGGVVIYLPAIDGEEETTQ